jgi:alanine racemase
VSAGYADGVRRHLGNRGVALVNGMRAPIAGVVTMDMTMLDVTGIACNVGDVATFVGRQGDHVLPIMDVAASGDVSPYELLVGLKLRAPRVYVYKSS